MIETPSLNASRRCWRGFTLVEMAIVLIIVSLLVGGMLMSLTSQQEIANVKETNRRLDDIKEALIGFAIANGRLPRPAKSATDGTERSDCNNDESACTGFIPWQVLGIQKTDSWDKLIRYSVSPEFAKTAFKLDTLGTKIIQTRDNAGNVVSLFGQVGGCPVDNPCAPAVIFSQGRQRFGTSADGVTLVGGTATSLDEANNDTNATTFISRTPTDNTAAAGGEFDDIVTWISPNVLFNRMVSASKLP